MTLDKKIQKAVAVNALDNEQGPLIWFLNPILYPSHLNHEYEKYQKKVEVTNVYFLQFSYCGLVIAVNVILFFNLFLFIF